MAEDQLKAASVDPFLEARIVMALERAPQTMIPAGFAARVAGRLPAQPSLVLKQRHFGSLAALASLAVLVALMPVFAHRGAASSLYSITIESLLCLQFGLLAVWFVARSAGYTLPSRF